MVVVLIGPPGSGKGTQSKLLAGFLNVPAFSTGEILRSVAVSGSSLGNELKAVLESGALVQDELVNRVVAERLASAECARGAILDGYPRTVVQAEYLDRLLRKMKRPPAAVLNFEIDPAAVFARLTARRGCPVCGRVYNLVTQPPAEDGFCDDDGMSLVARTDDDANVIRERMRAFDRQTAPVLNHYRGRLHRIDATRGDPQSVLAEIENRLGLSVPA